MFYKHILVDFIDILFLIKFLIPLGILFIGSVLLYIWFHRGLNPVNTVKIIYSTFSIVFLCTAFEPRGLTE